MKEYKVRLTLKCTGYDIEDALIRLKNETDIADYVDTSDEVEYEEVGNVKAIYVMSEVEGEH